MQPNQKKTPKIITETDDFGRKKFTLQQNSSQPQQQAQNQRLIDTGKHASTLIGRQQKLNIQKYIGKLQTTKKKKKTQVFYCQVCQVGFKCDIAYITHINSPSHNRKLGMNMKVQAVSADAVANKLAKMAEEKNKSKVEKILEKKLGKNWQQELIRKQEQDKANPSKVKQQKKEHSQNDNNSQAQNSKQQKIKAKKEENIKIQAKQEKQQKQQDQEQQELEEQQDEDQKMMKMLGLPTKFGSKTKKY